MPGWLPKGRQHFQAGLGRGEVELDVLVVQLALAQALAQRLARRVVTVGTGMGARQKNIEDAILGRVLGARLAAAHAHLALLLDGHFDEVADDGVDILADITDLGELGRLDLDEGRPGQLGQTPGDLGLADTRGADHQDVLGRDLAAQLLVHLLAAPAVAHRDGHGPLGGVLADDVAVQLRNDFLRGHRAHSRTSKVWLWLV